MIIIRMQGGLGNQLFQYALYEAFREMGREVKADITAYQTGKDQRELELYKLGIELEEADRQELHRYFADNRRLWDRAMRYLAGRNKYIKEHTYDYDPFVLQMTDGYLSGYWQSEKYFRRAVSDIRKRIRFQGVETDSLQKQVRQMETENSVSIHVRMGDYLGKQEMYGNICTPDYYKKAVEYIEQHVENPVFYLFSDAQEEAAGLPGKQKYCRMDGNTGQDAYKDMYLMSRCRHHIIANSTFSWWGAWLDEKPEKIVITPPKWNHFCKAGEICCDGWVMV